VGAQHAYAMYVNAGGSCHAPTVAARHVAVGQPKKKTRTRKQVTLQSVIMYVIM